MARLHITRIPETGGMLVIVADVLLPDGRKHDYAEYGHDGLKKIINRIRADRAHLRDCGVEPCLNL